jgi:uncharacterized membrane protein YoaK (UPF0700 family)
MFRQGKPRAFIHNLRLASILSFVAGLVNISGLLSIDTLTTNVTGHFAFFSEYFVNHDYSTAFAFISYILSFLCGAFVCSFLVEMVWRKSPGRSHTLPMLLEISILLGVSVTVSYIDQQWIARALLFAMGLQNALVTKVSQATVRTTHLTGLFTDLGIEVSQLFFYKEKTSLEKLSTSIYLRLAIIIFFFLGGVAGGFLYSEIELDTLIVAASALGIALVYDSVRVGFQRYLYRIKRL